MNRRAKTNPIHPRDCQLLHRSLSPKASSPQTPIHPCDRSPVATTPVAMVASSRLLHLAAAATSTAVATCFACPGGIGGASSRFASSASVMTPRASSGSCSAAAHGQDRLPARLSTARSASPSAQEEAVLRTRGGGAAAAGVGLGADDPGLAETDAEVWEIVNAERRRQVVVPESRQESELFRRQPGVQRVR